MPDSTIQTVHGRRVWDSRGRPTVEAEVTLAGGAVGRAIAPAGASMGGGEAVDLRDGGEAFGGLGVDAAVANVNDAIAKALKGKDAADQVAVDQAMIDADGSSNKGKLGGNALIAASMAAAHAAAAAAEMPLWAWLARDLAEDATVRLPLPQIQIFGGGAHAAGRIDVQDFMVTAPGARNVDEALRWTAEIYRAAGAALAEAGDLRGVADEGGYWPAFASNEAAIEALLRAIEAAGYGPGTQVGIALDIAASQFGQNGRYRLALDDKALDTEAWCAVLLDWIERFPILSLEDPFAEDDRDGFAALTEAVGGRVQIVADDLVVTDADRIRSAAEANAANAALIKPNQAGTLTEARAALDAANEARWQAIASARSGESEDVTIAHLAVGWQAGQIKVGAFARSERMAKWNELLRIEEALGKRGRFAGGAPLPART
jgi:enolase